MHRMLVVFALMMLVFIVWVSHQATLGNKNIFMEIVRATPYGDKVGHFVLFGMLSALAIGASKFRGSMFYGRKIYWAAIAVTLYALIDETIQYFSPIRTLDLYDLFAGLLGVILASVICKRVEKFI